MNLLKIWHLILSFAFILGFSISCSNGPSNQRSGGGFFGGEDAKKNGKGTAKGDDLENPHGDDGIVVEDDEGNEDKPLSGDTDVPPQGTGMEITQNDTSVAMRNFDQINYTMAAVTGVSTNNPQVRADFLELKSQLPPSNNLREVSPAKLSAITKLGARYCDVASQDATARAQLFPNVDFAQGPAAAFAQANTVAMDLLTQLWGSDLETLPDFGANVDIISTLISDMAAGKPDTPATTAAVAMGACAAAISSAPVITF